jgi:hypothetical protein
MIPSIDTYLQCEIEEKLKKILANPYIIEEILREFKSDVTAGFIKEYSTAPPNNGRRIPVLFTMPQERVTMQGAIFITLKEGMESEQSMGHIESLYTYKAGRHHKEIAVAQADDEKEWLFFEVTHPIGELESVEDIAFSRDDDVHVEGNKVLFRYDSSIEGEEFYVNYGSTSGDGVGTKKGFTTLEYFSVVPISTNMDVVRCLDALMKAVFILMRENPEEQRGVMLQKLSFKGVEPLNPTDDNNPELLYGREIIVSYTVTYSLDIEFPEQVDEIILKERLGREYEGEA